jgi:hypothetical protein
MCCSICSFPDGASCVQFRAPPSARGASARCRGSHHLSAPAAVHPSSGRWRAAASARAAASRSPPRAPRSSTTRASARSSPPGRSEGCATSVSLSPASSPRSCRCRPGHTWSRSCLRTATAVSAGAIIRRPVSPGSSGVDGTFRLGRCWSGRVRFAPSAGSAVESGSTTSAAPSGRDRRPGGCCSWTTSTPPARPSRQRRALSDTPEPRRSKSSLSHVPCGGEIV